MQCIPNTMLWSGFPDSSVGKESPWNAGDPGLIPGSGRSTGKGRGYPLQFLGFPCGSAGKESTCNPGYLCLIPGLGRSPGEGEGYPLQYSGLENSIDWTVHGVSKSQTWWSNIHFHTVIDNYSLTHLFEYFKVTIKESTVLDKGVVGEHVNKWSFYLGKKRN